MNVSKYIELYKINGNIESEAIILSFSKLLDKFDKFIVGGESLKSRLEDTSMGYKITADNESNNYVSIRYIDNGVEQTYYCPSGMDEVLRVCLVLLAGENYVVCKDTNLDGDCFEFIKSALSPFKVFEQPEERPGYYNQYFVLPVVDLSSEDWTELNNSINWTDIKRVIVPSNIDAQKFYDLLGRNMIIYGSTMVYTFPNDCMSEVKTVKEDNKSTVNFYDCIGSLDKELVNLANLLDMLADNTGNNISVDQFRDCKQRFILIRKCRDRLVEGSRDSDYVTVPNNGITKDSYCRLVGGLCASLTVFNKKRIILDCSRRVYYHYRDTVYKLIEGNYISPYYGLKRFYGMKSDLESDSPSNYKFSLIRENKLNDTISYPVMVENNQECYLFPLKMFFSFAVDTSIKNDISVENKVRVTLMRQKYSISVGDYDITNLDSDKCSRLVLQEGYGKLGKIFENEGSDDFNAVKNICSVSELLGDKILFEDDVEVEQLGSFSFSFKVKNSDEDLSDKLVLHDLILGKPVSNDWLTLLMLYIISMQKKPNKSDPKEDVDNLAKSMLKALGVDLAKGKNSISSLFDCSEWTTDEKASKSTDGDGVVFSEKAFKSVNYQKSEFYSCVCDIISNFIKEATGNSTYVTLHDIMLCSRYVNENQTDFYIMYYPVKPKVTWATVKHSIQKSGDEDGTPEEFDTEYLNRDTELYLDSCRKMEAMPDFIFTRDKQEEINNMYISYLKINDFYQTIENRDNADTVDELLSELRLRDKKELMYDAMDKIDSQEEFDNFISNSVNCHNIFDYHGYFSEEEINGFELQALWFIATQFIGEKCLVGDNNKLTVLELLYSNYYNVIGYENLEELSTLISPEKHLYYSRVINPFGGVIRTGNVGESFKSDRADKFVLCCTNGPEDSKVIQIISNKYVSEDSV